MVPGEKFCRSCLLTLFPSSYLTLFTSLFFGFHKKIWDSLWPSSKYSMQQVQLFVSATSIWCSSPHAFGMWFGLQSLWSARLTARVTVHVCQPNNPSVILRERHLQYQIVILINSSRKISQPSWCGRKSCGLFIFQMTFRPNPVCMETAQTRAKIGEF